MQVKERFHHSVEVTVPIISKAFMHQVCEAAKISCQAFSCILPLFRHSWHAKASEGYFLFYFNISKIMRMFPDSCLILVAHEITTLDN